MTVHGSRMTLISTLLAATASVAAAGESRVIPVEARLDSIDVLSINHAPSDPLSTVTDRRPLLRGDCPSEIHTLTDSDFGPGQYVLQAGFEEGESAAISFSLPAEAFPVRLDLAEILFATFNSTVQTTTEWSFKAYSGKPDTGSLVAEYSSDGVILPHLVMPPGTNGTIIAFGIDPTDPNQIFIPDNGSGEITIAFRIDAHNMPGSPCLSPPNENMNAFPATDTSGLQFPAGNWLDLVDGAFCICGVGWRSFQQLPTLCRPSGDWVIRATLTPFNCGGSVGACCTSDGSCSDLTEIECEVISGDFQGDGTICSDLQCPEPTAACCVPSTGECVDASESLCNAFSGTWWSGQSCADIVCFPVGACCLPDGSCVPDSTPESCVAFSGTFQGDATDCDVVECPEPEGWCCTDTGDCFELTQATCLAFGGIYGGDGSTCIDPDACDDSSDCVGDTTGDGVVNVDDVLDVLANYGSDGSSGDADGDNDVDVDDVLLVINGWGDC
ncbi:MAG: hypothetical protein CMJ29_02810 [Phycisphaerae bacterium]|nr:hypothetical protein [Phycisphaerae bacterium]MAT80560.1 hypothetical protein [Phycisphaerae bacterium]